MVVVVRAVLTVLMLMRCGYPMQVVVGMIPAMRVFVRVGMLLRMSMGVLVHMYDIAVPMFMGVHVRMGVGVRMFMGMAMSGVVLMAVVVLGHGRAPISMAI